LTQVYDGKAKVATSDTSPIIAPVYLTYDGRSNPPTNAGVHIVSATITNSNNYFGSASNALTILKANATVTLTNLNHVYDGTPKSVLASVTPPGLKLTVTYNDQTQAPSAVGTYAAVGTVVDPNYAGSAMSWLTISAKPLIASRGSTPTDPPNPVTSDLRPIASGQTLFVTWPDTTSDVTLWESADLLTWLPLTNITGSSSSASIVPKAGSRFIRATRAGFDGTTGLPVSIGNRSPGSLARFPSAQ
jgi:hypothetical protein